MFRRKHAQRAAMLLMVLAVGFLWAADQGLRAATADHAAKIATLTASAVKTYSGAVAKITTPTGSTLARPATTTKADAQQMASGQQKSKSPMPMRQITQTQRKAAAASKVKAAGGGMITAMNLVPGPNGFLVPDYFGPYSNWANSPLPGGPVTAVTLTAGGTGYCATPTVTISDFYGVGTGAAVGAPTATGGIVDPLVLASPGAGYVAPVVTITDCLGGTGTGATATATIAGAPAYTGGLRKFIDSLPGLVAAVPDTLTYPGSDYYEIELVQYTQQLHADLLPTTLRGYRQTNNGTDQANLACTPLPGCANTIAPPAAPSYLGPLIIGQRDRPTRIKFTNNLPTGAAGDLFIPTDVTMMGAGSGYDPVTATTVPYTQNRGSLHLHGGFTPWISDGTPHQWVVPAAEATAHKQGASTESVPDMAVPAGGSMTFYYPNQQSGRLMFYHDHAYGITRLNVYAGEAAGYLLVDPVERGLNATLGIPASSEIPLVIQDKTFVWGTPGATPGAAGAGTWATDPSWDATKWGATQGSLWFPHVYMPNQNPWDISGANAMGRWDYALWFWPPFTGLIANATIANPYYDPINAPWEPPEIPGTPNPSLVPEAFMDTPVVNGKAYPTLNVPAGPVRFRILNAANDRFWNLSLFLAADKTTPTTATTSGPLTRLCDGLSGALVPDCTEVKMVPFNSSQNMVTPFPSWWYTPGLNFVFDDRAGGVPDPTTRGPAMIQIGTEGGLLPAPAVIRNQPVNYTYNRRDIVVLSVQEKALFLGPAERADVIVDFSGFAGKTLILYNDAPAPVPAARPAHRLLHGRRRSDRHGRRAADAARLRSQHPDNHADRRRGKRGDRGGPTMSTRRSSRRFRPRCRRHSPRPRIRSSCRRSPTTPCIPPARRPPTWSGPTCRASRPPR